MEQENNKNYYSSFKFYNERKRRLSLFARETDDGYIEIFKIACSRKDMFCKQCGRDVYSFYRNSNPEDNEGATPIQLKGVVYHPEIYRVKIEEGNGPKYTFLHHCFTSFYKQYMKAVTKPILIRGFKVKSL